MGTALPARILIVRLGALGDVVNALALANALKLARPDVHIGWACHGLALPLVTDHPSIARVHVWRRGSGPAGWIEVLREIRAERYDVALDLQRLTKSALLTRLSGATRCIGFDRKRAKEGSWIWSRERVSAASFERPMAEQALDFARYMGIEAPVVELDLPRHSEAEAWAENWLGKHRAAPILLNLGATKPANRWPAAHWGLLARRLGEWGPNPIVLTGGPDDRLVASVASKAAAAPILDLVGETSLVQLIALQRRAALVISCDTGPMHTAAAVGAPVLALFGAADERRTGPYGQIQYVQRTRPDCAPCGKRACPLPRHACMLDLTVEAVYEAAVRRLGATQRR